MSESRYQYALLIVSHITQICLIFNKTGASLRLLAGGTEQARHGGNILRDGAVRHEPALLHDVADAAAQLVGVLFVHIHAVNGDGAAIGLDHAVNHAQTSGFTTSGGTDEHGNLPGGDVQVQVLQHRGGFTGSARIALGDVLEADSTCGVAYCLSAAGGRIFCPGNLMRVLLV